MRKAAVYLMALSLCLGAASGVWADDNKLDGEGSADTHFTLYVEEETNEPSFLISIPADVVLDAENATPVSIEASEVKDLDGKSISAQFGGTQFTQNQLVLQDGTQGNYKILLYNLLDAKGNVLVDTRGNGNTADGLIGTELVSFTEDGAENYQVAIRNEMFDPEPVAGVLYYGTLTYNIALVD